MQPNPALASNAGDRYHFVYVSRKLLNLLYPRSALVRVEVEGVAEEDAGEEFDEALSKAEASKRIDELRERSPRLAQE
jgi:hypothetical protein